MASSANGSGDGAAGAGSATGPVHPPAPPAGDATGAGEGSSAAPVVELPPLPNSSRDSLRPFLGVLNQDPRNEVLQLRGLRAVSALSRDPEHHLPLLYCLNWLKVALDNHGANERVAAEALRILARVGETEACRPMLMAVLPTALAALDAHAGTTIVARHGVELLAHLAAAANNAVPLLPAVPVVVNVLRRHAEAASVVSQGLEVLVTVAAHGDNEVALMRALPCVLSALRTHVEDAPVVHRCLSILLSLSMFDDDKVPLMAAVPLVLPALKTHSAVLPVVESGVALLHSLSAHADNGISLSKSALPSVLATLLRHGDHPSVVLGGLGCLANLSLPVDNRSVLMGAVPTLLTTLQRRCGPEAVLAAVHGLTALRLLSTVWDNTMVLTEQVVPAMVDVLCMHAGAVEVVCPAVVTLRNLAFHALNDDVGLTVLGEGFEAVVPGVVLEDPGAGEDVDNDSALLPALPTVVATLPRHAHTTAVAEAGLALVWNLSAASSRAARLVASVTGVRRLMSTFMARHPSSAVVSAWGPILLARLEQHRVPGEEERLDAEAREAAFPSGYPSLPGAPVVGGGGDAGFGGAGVPLGAGPYPVAPDPASLPPLPTLLASSAPVPVPAPAPARASDPYVASPATSPDATPVNAGAGSATVAGAAATGAAATGAAAAGAAAAGAAATGAAASSAAATGAAAGAGTGAAATGGAGSGVGTSTHARPSPVLSESAAIMEALTQWRANITTGARCDVLDGSGVWREASVLADVGNALRVHFLCHPLPDVWMDRNSPAVAPPESRVRDLRAFKANDRVDVCVDGAWGLATVVSVDVASSTVQLLPLLAPKGTPALWFDAMSDAIAEAHTHVPVPAGPEAGPPLPFTCLGSVAIVPVLTLGEVGAMLDAARVSTHVCVALGGAGASKGAPGASQRAAVLILCASGGGPVFVVDLFGIGEVVWDTPCAGDSTVTLRSILASPLPRKILWDCRLDSYTLWHHHGVILEHLDDLQVAIAHTMPAAEYLPGLSGKVLQKWVDQYSGPGGVRRPHGSTAPSTPTITRVCSTFDATVELGKHLCNPKFGGDVSVWRTRPMHPVLLAYSAQRAAALALMLWFSSRIVRAMTNPAVQRECERRVAASSNGTFLPHDSEANVCNPFGPKGVVAGAGSGATTPGL